MEIEPHAGETIVQVVSQVRGEAQVDVWDSSKHAGLHTAELALAVTMRRRQGGRGSSRGLRFRMHGA